jgi:hypothetical protein
MQVAKYRQAYATSVKLVTGEKNVQTLALKIVSQQKVVIEKKAIALNVLRVNILKLVLLNVQAIVF